MSLVARPRGLSRYESGGVGFLTDDGLREAGALVVFTERGGGGSVAPYASLNLAAHVGDDPSCVDANRDLLMTALGLDGQRERLTVAEQVHGALVELVTEAEAGAGAFAAPGCRLPLPGADALVTDLEATPLMLFFADCVPVVLVAATERPAVAVAHAGWRGALAGIAGKTARRLCEVAACGPSEVVAYIGPRICGEHYEVSDETMFQFAERFETIAAAPKCLDLGAAVKQDLLESGVSLESQFDASLCTIENTERFFSYRGEGVTGRHAALAVITGMER